MKSSHRTKLLLVLVGTLSVGLGVASAQPAQPEPAAAATPEVGAPAIGAPAEVTLTPTQMFEQAERSLEQMESGAETLQGQLREARQARDVVKALCLDDKLTQMNVAKRTAAERVASLEAASKSANVERSRHEFAVISALSERAQALTAEANQCLGEELGYLGESRLTLTVDPNVADADPAVPTDSLESGRPVLYQPPPPVVSPID
jgi:hypothetical protein